MILFWQCGLPTKKIKILPWGYLVTLHGKVSFVYFFYHLQSVCLVIFTTIREYRYWVKGTTPLKYWYATMRSGQHCLVHPRNYERTARWVLSGYLRLSPASEGTSVGWSGDSKLSVIVNVCVNVCLSVMERWLVQSVPHLCPMMAGMGCSKDRKWMDGANHWFSAHDRASVAISRLVNWLAT